MNKGVKRGGRLSIALLITSLLFVLIAYNAEARSGRFAPRQLGSKPALVGMVAPQPRMAQATATPKSFGRATATPRGRANASTVPAPRLVAFDGKTFSWRWDGQPQVGNQNWHFEIQLYMLASQDPSRIIIVTPLQARLVNGVWSFRQWGPVPCGSYWVVQIALRKNGAPAGWISPKSDRKEIRSACGPDTPSAGYMPDTAQAANAGNVPVPTPSSLSAGFPTPNPPVFYTLPTLEPDDDPTPTPCLDCG